MRNLWKSIFGSGKATKSAVVQKTWVDIEYFEDSWVERTRIMAQFIPEGASVLDLGCGKCWLKDIKKMSAYFPVDYKRRSEDTIICDFNKYEFPDKHTDIAFVSGCLEYVNDPKWFVKKIKENCSESVVSYCTIDAFFNKHGRISNCWVNHFSRKELIELFTDTGFELVGESYYEPNNSIFHFSARAVEHSLRDRRANYYSLPAQVVASNLTYLDKTAISEIIETVEFLEIRNKEGVIVEAGCALGGSSIIIANVKNRNRTLKLYDVFGMIPAPGERDPESVHERYKEITAGQSTGIGGDKYYGYEDNLLEKVKSNFIKFGIDPVTNNIEFIKGLYENTMRIEEPVMLAHIDCDWYDSVMVCLKQIAPKLVPGGVIIIDDYHYWPGCKQAVDEYFSGKSAEFELRIKSRLHIVKK